MEDSIEVLEGGIAVVRDLPGLGTCEFGFAINPPSADGGVAVDYVGYVAGLPVRRNFPDSGEPSRVGTYTLRPDGWLVETDVPADLPDALKSFLQECVLRALALNHRY